MPACFIGEQSNPSRSFVKLQTLTSGKYASLRVSAINIFFAFVLDNQVVFLEFEEHSLEAFWCGVEWLEHHGL